MITYKALRLGSIPGASPLRPGTYLTPQPPLVQQAIQAAGAAGGNAQTACASPDLTTERQRSYCAESYMAGLRGHDLVVNALAKDACDHAVQQGLISPDAQTTCVSCAQHAILGEFSVDQIPSCVAAGGIGPAIGGATSFLSKYKVPIVIGGVLIAGLIAWRVVS